ncbi:MAG: ZIP family metal transporter, partial [Candidatus Krumholzibacteriota bacterium]|nr:ZIP family metal transporter [Candidatus Krumholzibacteriota bacterium]
MTVFLEKFDPLVQALIATLFTWGMTAVGAATVFFVDQVNRKLLDWMLGFAGGVMIAASFWALLVPSIEMYADRTLPSWFPAAAGFILGAVLLRVVDR